MHGGPSVQCHHVTQRAHLRCSPKGTDSSDPNRHLHAMLTAAPLTAAKGRRRERPAAKRGRSVSRGGGPTLREGSLTPATAGAKVRSEGSQSQRTAAVGLHSNAVSRGGKFTRTESGAAVPGWRWGHGELLSTGDGAPVHEDETVLGTVVRMTSRPCECA